MFQKLNNWDVFWIPQSPSDSSICTKQCYQAPRVRFKLSQRIGSDANSPWEIGTSFQFYHSLFAFFLATSISQYRHRRLFLFILYLRTTTLFIYNSAIQLSLHFFAGCSRREARARVLVFFGVFYLTSYLRIYAIALRVELPV